MKWLPLFILLVFLPQDLPEPKANAENTRLNEHLAFFEPYLEKTYRGEFAQSTPEKPIVDIARWERALNGQAVRILHSVNNGDYGGESVMMWDAKEEKLIFWYFTTAGFHTTGTLQFADKKWITTEKVSGNTNGITEVRATSEPTFDGGYITKSEYFKNGKWERGSERTYRVAPDAQVIFK